MAPLDNNKSLTNRMVQTNEHESLRIAQQLLNRLSYSAATRDLTEHMSLISEKVRVFGLASGVVDYAGFKRRRHNEFKGKMLLSITYKEVRLLPGSNGEISFAVKETLKSTRGESFVLDKEVHLQREHDGEWRVVCEMITLVTRK